MVRSENLLNGICGKYLAKSDTQYVTAGTNRDA